eukprot:8316223-Pyramimonas_sp.AAC.1
MVKVGNASEALGGRALTVASSGDSKDTSVRAHLHGAQLVLAYVACADDELDFCAISESTVSRISTCDRVDVRSSHRRVA